MLVSGRVEQAVDVVLHAGEMSFHHADIIHGSNPNTSTGGRIAFAVRYVAAGVRQEKPHRPVILARGQDLDHHYEIQEKRIAGFEQGLVAHRMFEGDRGNRWRITLLRVALPLQSLDPTAK